MKRKKIQTAKEAFKKHLEDNGVYEVFLVNLISSLDFDEHCRLCETMFLSGFTERIEYIDLVVRYSDGSDWDRINKEWIEIFNKLNND